MKKRILTLLFAFALGCALFAGSTRADTPADDTGTVPAAGNPDATAVPATATAPAEPQGSVSTESKSPSYENKFFRRKHSDADDAASAAIKEEARKAKQAMKEKKAREAALAKEAKEEKAREKKESKEAKKREDRAAREEKARQAKEARAAGKVNDAPKLSDSQESVSLGKPAKKIKGKASRYIEESKKYYIEGEIDKAAANINRAIELDPQNEAARSFRDKILTIKEKMVEARKDFSEHCYFEGANYLKEGNTLDALLFVNRAMKLNSQSEKTKALYASIQETNQNFINSMGVKDGKKLKKGINCFVNEDFDGAVEIFRKLQPFHSEVSNFLGYALMRTTDSDNKKRARYFVNEAMIDVRNERYKKAQEDLFEAMEMDREDVDAKVMFEQVNIELNMSYKMPVGSLSQPSQQAE